MLATNDRQVIADGDVGGRRQQRARWTTETRIGRAPAEAGVGDAVIEAPSGEELLVSKTEGLAFPKFTNRWNPLAIPGRVDLRFVNQLGTNEPGVRNLIAVPGTQAIGGNRGQCRGDEGTVGINQIVIVMEVTAVDGVLFIEAVIKPDVILAPVEWVRLLEGGIVCRCRVRVSHGELLHGAVNRSNGFAIGRETNRHAVKSEIGKVPSWNWLAGGNRCAGGRIDRRVTSRNIQRPAAGTEVA